MVSHDSRKDHRESEMEKIMTHRFRRNHTEIKAKHRHTERGRTWGICLIRVYDG